MAVAAWGRRGGGASLGVHANSLELGSRDSCTAGDCTKALPTWALSKSEFCDMHIISQLKSS